MRGSGRGEKEKCYVSRYSLRWKGGQKGNMDIVTNSGGNRDGERDPCGDCGCNRSGDHGGDHVGDHVGDHGGDHGSDHGGNILKHVVKDVYDPEFVAVQMRKIIG